MTYSALAGKCQLEGLTLAAALLLVRQNFNQLLVLLGDDRGLVKEEMELEGMDQLEVWWGVQLTAAVDLPVKEI